MSGANPFSRECIASAVPGALPEGERPNERAVTDYLARRVAAELSAWAGRHAEAVSERAAAQIVDLTAARREQRQEAHR